jgi:hypothetical protein
LKFAGKFYLRSSASSEPGQAPGESEILMLNPERRMRIIAATGWGFLESGSFNLAVDQPIVDGLLSYKPALVEDAASIKYPSGFERIPLKRKAYYYYRGTAFAQSKTHDVLVRRAQVPVKGCVELFASENLTRYFNVANGDRVDVELNRPVLQDFV